MARNTLYSIIESPMHPNLTAVYERCGIEEIKFNSLRKAISHLKIRLPDIIVADFLYGYGNNYAGVNVSNLDVFLASLQKYKADTKIIVFVEKEEQQYVEKLHALFPLTTALIYPVKAQHMEIVLQELGLCVDTVKR